MALSKLFRKLLTLGMLAFFMSGCAVFNHFFPDKSLEYQKYKSQTGLTMPEGIKTDRISDQMPVPDISPALKEVPLPKDVDRPAPLNVGLMNMGVQKRSAGDLQWLYIDRTASEVWPELLVWFEKHGIKLEKSVPTKGLLESEVQGEESYLLKLEKDKKKVPVEQGTAVQNSYRIMVKLQPGMQRGSSKLQIVVTRKLNQWPEVSDLPHLENAALDDLSEYLGNALEKKKSVSLLAQEMKRNFEATLITDNVDQPYVLINQDFNQSWYMVGNAIRKARMPLFDINRSLGLYYLSTEHKDADNYSFTKKLKAHSEYYKLTNQGDFMVYVHETDQGCEVKIKISEEKFADKDLSIFVLKTLRDNMELHPDQ